MSFNRFNNNTNNLAATNTTQLWMGELDPWWDESSIKAIWTQFGFPSVNVKLIKEKIQSGNNAGYCFIEFPTLELATTALNSNGAKIPNTNRFLKLNWASGHQQQQQSQGGQQGQRSNEISVFVGDLAPDVSETILFEFFGAKYSSVSSTKIMIDPATGQSKGYGFVRFLNELDQQRALIEMQGAILNGRPIRVSTAVPKNRQNQQQQPFMNQRHQQPFQQSQQHHYQQQQQLPTSNPQSQQILGSLDAQYQPPLNQYTDPNNTTVFIGGLSSIVTEEDLRLYFQPFGEITYVKIPVGKGCGFVQYITRASAELAISKMQGYPIGNSRIRLSWGRSNSSQQQLQQPQQQYKPQPELPLLYGYQQTQYPNDFTFQQQQASQQIQQQQQAQQFQADPTEVIDQSRLNQLFIAARDGRLDAIDSNSNGYIFA